MSNTNLYNAFGSHALVFENTAVQIIDRDGTPWLTAADLSRALGYKELDAVSKIYNRRKDEFTDKMTTLITLQANEINAAPSLAGVSSPDKTVRVFSPRGCWTIGYFSRTEKAKAFRSWVSDVLENLNQQPEIKPAAPKQELPSFLQSNNGKVLFKDAAISSAHHLLTQCDFSEEQRYMQERIDKRVASRMEDIACHEYEGLRLLMETDGIGGFDTRQIMPGIHLLENNQLAEHILSAKGPTASYIPAIMQACVQRMQDVCDLPLAGLQFEELDS